VAFSEDDLLPLSALQHLVFCERQYALIHVERAWKDNPLTLEGSHLHGRVHEEAPRRELRRDTMITRRVALRSHTLGVSGIADVVEFHRVGTERPEAGVVPSATVALAGLAGRWAPRPVEYKRGRPKANDCDRVQLCAQAICLEEMLGVVISEGDLFYGADRRRTAVLFDEELRRATAAAAARIHEIFRSGITPRARKEPKCRSCSLLELCRPDAMAPRRSARRFVLETFRAAMADEERST
jgi:CRISPR-associated exonuclease Cas4